MCTNLHVPLSTLSSPKWGSVGSGGQYLLTYPAFTPKFFLQNFIFKQAVKIASSSAATTVVLSVSPFMYPNFSHRHDYSLSTSFSSK
jgi:hypothetical protein